jgi:hypothetical protein
MIWTLLSVWTLCFLAGTNSQAVAKDLPTEWPPLPDFKKPVDYVKWTQEQLAAPPEDDARPLWDEITEKEADSQEVKQAKAKMWGYTEDYRIPGLLTGIDSPERYAWDSTDHPEWEQAYQAQMAAGLPAKLIAISQRKHLSQPLMFPDPQKLLQGANGSESQPSSQPVDVGLTAEDRSLLLILLPSLSGNRQAARVLLQNAWRAPQGKVDAKAMHDAIATCLGLADQMSSTLPIHHLVKLAIRDLAYDSLIRALDEQVFDSEQIIRMDQLLTKNDGRELTTVEYDAQMIATVLDTLQFAYRLDSPTGPKPDTDHVQKLAKCANASYKANPEYQNAPLDIAGEINRCDPQTAVNQLVDLFLEVRRIQKSERPQVAEVQVKRLIEEFKKNPANHVVSRQFIWETTQWITLSARGETRRRATHLLYALHREYNRTGKWPASLKNTPRLPRTIRTDPFSGKDFCYRIENGQPLLYSVATNGQDDGGKHDPRWGESWKGKSWKDGQITFTDTDYVFWPIPPRK